ncbi:hypothetical protein SP18gp170 [Shigella phage SP18]|uniref:Uncharacterized protein n=1 Tax=Shigella phage SP18 TaxID=645664 RepID=E3SEX3_BPSP8|nr:hypothetical protein SP18_gp170 [Shigella phage SP18]ADO19510.1 hypothetical protein SP18gp170 [Shigella phage SP18]
MKQNLKIGVMVDDGTGDYLRLGGQKLIITLMTFTTSSVMEKILMLLVHGKHGQ